MALLFMDYDLKVLEEIMTEDPLVEESPDLKETVLDVSEKYACVIRVQPCVCYRGTHAPGFKAYRELTE